MATQNAWFNVPPRPGFEDITYHDGRTHVGDNNLAKQRHCTQSIFVILDCVHFNQTKFIKPALNDKKDYFLCTSDLYSLVS